ncbi:unnamed protein product [Lactuca virosa]|uniref:3-hydroxyacyl-CoA dehydrogenase NAD binding domain-containing protein n=1 Tax=Lactuca virosa TaxID=75947 RepID=A0AAU9N812_9ASTR|nr:unnamed protein product [Lactuca virosa]
MDNKAVQLFNAMLKQQLQFLASNLPQVWKLQIKVVVEPGLPYHSSLLSATVADPRSARQRYPSDPAPSWSSPKRSNSTSTNPTTSQVQNEDDIDTTEKLGAQNFSPSVTSFASADMAVRQRPHQKKYKLRTGRVNVSHSHKPGEQAYKKWNLSEAEVCYSKGISSIQHIETPVVCIKPLLLCYSNRAAIRMALGRMREGLNDCRMAVALDPNFMNVNLRSAKRIIIEATEGLQKAQKVSNYLKLAAEILEQKTHESALLNNVFYPLLLVYKEHIFTKFVVKLARMEDFQVDLTSIFFRKFTRLETFLNYLMYYAKKPIVAVVQGLALRGGLELAMGCHACVAAPRAQLGLPEFSLGVMPGFGGGEGVPRGWLFFRHIEGLVHIMLCTNVQSQVPKVLMVSKAKKKVKKVDVIGGGLMGSGIAMALILANVKDWLQGRSYHRVKVKGIVIATNHPPLDLNLIGEKIKSQDRVIGAHFFSLAHVMPLLEIVRTEKQCKDKLLPATPGGQPPK